MKSLLAAISVLSILPMGRFSPSERELKRAVNFFPTVGLLLALIVLILGYGIFRIFPSLPASMVMVLLPEIFSKGFHLDGLADTADGFLSSRSRERMLEIMHDSRIGTMGVLAIVAVLGLKLTLLFSLSFPMQLLGIPLGMLTGRSAVTWYIATSRYARSEGMGSIWFGRCPVGGVVTGLLLPVGIGFYAGGILGATAAGVVLLFSLLWSVITRMVIGGATGDTIGALVELSELLVLVVLVVMSSGMVS